MKKLIIVAIALLISAPAIAQTTTTTSTSTSTATAGNTTVNVGGGGTSASGGTGGNGGSGGNVSNVMPAPKRNPVASATSAALWAGDDTCMGSSSAGGQAVGFGLSVGSTWHDDDCVRRKDARELYNMKYPEAAIALLCQSDNVAQAMNAAGTPCPGHATAPVKRNSSYNSSKYPSMQHAH